MAVAAAALAVAGFGKADTVATQQPRRDLRAEIFDRERVVQEQIFTCMTAAGFEFVLQDPRSYLSVTNRSAIDYDAEPGTREWAQQHGLGITTQAFEARFLPDDLKGTATEEPEEIPVDPNDERVAQMSEEEAGAWQDQYFDCFNEAQDAVPLQPPEYRRTEEERAASWEAEQRLLADPRLTAIKKELSDCVAAAGYPPIGELGTAGHIVDKYTDLIHGDGDDLDADAIEELREAQAYEIGYAVAVFDCEVETRLYERINELRDELGAP